MRQRPRPENFPVALHGSLVSPSCSLQGTGTVQAAVTAGLCHVERDLPNGPAFSPNTGTTSRTGPCKPAQEEEEKGWVGGVTFVPAACLALL